MLMLCFEIFRDLLDSITLFYVQSYFIFSYFFLFAPLILHSVSEFHQFFPLLSLQALDFFALKIIIGQPGLLPKVKYHQKLKPKPNQFKPNLFRQKRRINLYK